MHIRNVSFSGATTLGAAHSAYAGSVTFLTSILPISTSQSPFSSAQRDKMPNGGIWLFLGEDRSGASSHIFHQFGRLIWLGIPWAFREIRLYACSLFQEAGLDLNVPVDRWLVGIFLLNCRRDQGFYCGGNCIHCDTYRRFYQAVQFIFISFSPHFFFYE